VENRVALCEVVAAIADAVIVGRQPLTATEAALLQVIKGISYYRDIKRLDAWESAVNEITPRDLASTNTGRLIEELIMLGLCNLYQQFQPRRTQEYYARLVPIFAEAGIRLPKEPDLSGW
jgi:hypothetical protein